VFHGYYPNNIITANINNISDNRIKIRICYQQKSRLLVTTVNNQLVHFSAAIPFATTQHVDSNHKVQNLYVVPALINLIFPPLSVDETNATCPFNKAF
jgi:hypothetical protein